MEPPAAPPPLSAAATAAYVDSVDSSPRSRNTDSWDESLYQSTVVQSGVAATAGFTKLRLMCSYGGHIVPRPHDKSLCYVGGDTRIVVVDRHTSLSDLTHRLAKTLLQNRSSSFTLKYQLPNEDLDSLISVTTDEDLENMIDEYERLNSSPTTTTAAAGVGGGGSNNNKSSRLRLFLFPTKPESASSIGSLLENSTKSEDWFLNALNGTSSGFSDTSSVNCLLGLDDDVSVHGKVKDSESQIESFGNAKGMTTGGSGHGAGSNSSKNLMHDVHSVPDSPMLETTSSFGSASSSPSLANLPPIRVHVEDQKVGVEEQFAQMSVQQKQDDGGLLTISSPPNSVPPVTIITGVPTSSTTVIGEYPNRAFSDDERSEHGLHMGYRKPPQQFQTRQATGPDLASPDSVSSDGSLTNQLSRQKPAVVYQDPIVQIQSSNNRASPNPVDPNIPDPNPRIQMQQQIQDSGYLMQNQFDPQHQQLHHPQQFIQAAPQYINHPPGAVPMASYYQLYPSQQPQPLHPGLDQPNFVYYMPARQAQGYNLHLQQPSYAEPSPAAPPPRNQTPPPASGVYTTTRNAPTPKSELPAAVYRTANSAAQQLVQPQFVGYTPIHHPSQSVASNASATSNFGFEYATDHTQAQHIYYAQHMPPQSTAQYQTMTTSLPDTGSHLPVENNMNQQVRSAQP